jgi:hypothetical protein
MNRHQKRKFVNDFLENAKQEFSPEIIEMEPALERTAEALWEVNNFTISPVDEPALNQNLRSILEE